jgi:hypothetical protein
LIAEHRANLRLVCPWCYSPSHQFRFDELRDELVNASHRMVCLKKLINQQQNLIRFHRKLQCRYCHESHLPRNMSEHVRMSHDDERALRQCVFCGADASVCDWSCVGVRSKQKFSIELKKKYQVVDALHTFTKHQKQTLEVGLAIHDRLTQHLMVKDDIITQKDTIIIEKDEQLAEKDKKIAERDLVIISKDEIIAEKDQIIYKLALENPANKKRKVNKK